MCFLLSQGLRFDAPDALNEAAQELLRMSKPGRAPDVHAHMALQGMARLAAEVHMQSVYVCTVVCVSLSVARLCDSVFVACICVRLHTAMQGLCVRLRVRLLRLLCRWLFVLLVHAPLSSIHISLCCFEHACLRWESMKMKNNPQHEQALKPRPCMPAIAYHCGG